MRSISKLLIPVFYREKFKGSQICGRIWSNTSAAAAGMDDTVAAMAVLAWILHARVDSRRGERARQSRMFGFSPIIFFFASSEPPQRSRGS